MNPLRAVLLFTVICLILETCFQSTVFGQAPASEDVQIKSIEELVTIFERDKINHEAKLDQLYVAVPIQRGGFKSVQVIRWVVNDGVVHFIQVIPIKIPAEQLPSMESALVRLNHSYPVPGLGLNHENLTPYFRLTVPLQPRGYLLESEIKEYFSFCVSQALQFTPTLAGIANGDVPAEGALAYHRERIQAAIGPLGIWKREFGGNLWQLSINQKGEATVRRDGEVVVDSMVTVQGDQITFDDITGPLAVDETGTYQFKIEGKSMSLSPLEETAAGRKEVLSGGPWTR